MTSSSSKFNSISELESALYTSSIGGRSKKKIHSQDIKGDGIEIFILQRSKQNELISRGIYFGSSARIFMIDDYYADDKRNELADLLITIIMHGYLRVDEWSSTIGRHTKEEVKSNFDKSTTIKSLSIGVLRPKLMLEFHIVDTKPIRCRQRFAVDQLVEDELIEQFTSKIADVTEVDIKSQMLYYVRFPNEPIFDRKRQFHYLDPNQLQHTINPIETYLGTVVTTEPVYHMLLYIPSKNVRPLMIVDEKFAPVPYNSFVVSGWGSVTVVNANRSCSSDGSSIEIDTESISSTKLSIVANLRKFFGLQIPSMFEQTTTTTSLADWELQSLRYRAVVEYVFSSVRTLNTLTKLLSEITNIVINDEIASSINTAVQEIRSVFDFGRDSKKNGGGGGDGGHWRIQSMLKSARRAFDEAEKAFFDPSLLALLYFPNEQKYAIYIPLFLPIGLPVLGSIFYIYRYYKERKVANMMAPYQIGVGKN